jgi:hypothetical protein
MRPDIGSERVKIHPRIKALPKKLTIPQLRNSTFLRQPKRIRTVLTRD